MEMAERDKEIAAVYPWYEPHLKWVHGENGGCRANLGGADLSRANLSRANLGGADLSRADLSRANLRRAYLGDANLSRANLSRADLGRANLSRANLRRAYLGDANLGGANLSRANLSRANLGGANLGGANLGDAIMPGFPDDPPSSLSEAAKRTRDWLAEDGRWVKGKWINTPQGAYSGHCSACLHGAAIYVGGPFGRKLSNALDSAGFTVKWNDDSTRTVEDVLKALDQIAEQADTPA